MKDILRKLPIEKLPPPQMNTVPNRRREHGTSYFRTTAKFDGLRDRIAAVNMLVQSLSADSPLYKLYSDQLKEDHSAVARFRSQRGRDLREAGIRIRSKRRDDLKFPTIVFEPNGSYSNN